MKKVNVSVYSANGEEKEKITLDSNVFAVETNEQVMFDAIQVYQANKRQATAKTKTRSEVSGGGKKPFRQKGTGRARAGSTRSPIWVGGGNALGPDGNQSYKLSQNKKAHKLALKSALSLKTKDGLIVVDEFKTNGKTKEISELLKALKADKKVLLVTDDELVHQGAKNLENVVIRDVNNISVYDLLNVNHVVISKLDIKKVEEALK